MPLHLDAAAADYYHYAEAESASAVAAANMWDEFD